MYPLSEQKNESHNVPEAKVSHKRKKRLDIPLLVRSSYERPVIKCPTQITPVSIADQSREGITIGKIMHALELFFRPALTETFQHLEHFTELDVDDLKNRFRAMILGVRGTLVPHGCEEIDPQILQKVLEIREKLPVCFFSNSTNRPPALIQTGIPFARHVPPKPDPTGFLVALELHLQGRQKTKDRLHPHQCAMVGSNFLTDGGCRKAGMAFIHVKPLPGNERFLHRISRSIAEKIANFYEGLR